MLALLTPERRWLSCCLLRHKHVSIRTLSQKEITMLVRRVWPSRPTFESPFTDCNQARREMLRLFDTVAADTARDVGAAVLPPLNITQDETA
jgi:hypothetical protein